MRVFLAGVAAIALFGLAVIAGIHLATREPPAAVAIPAGIAAAPAATVPAPSPEAGAISASTAAGVAPPTATAPAAVAAAAGAPRDKGAPVAAEVKVAFKVDPRLTGGMHLGERWVSPPKFTTTHSRDGGKTVTVEVRARAVDAEGRSVGGATPTWWAADPDVVAVSSGEGDRVELSVKRAGTTDLAVTAGGATARYTVVAAGSPSPVRVSIAAR